MTPKVRSVDDADYPMLASQPIAIRDCCLELKSKEVGEISQECKKDMAAEQTEAQIMFPLNILYADHIKKIQCLHWLDLDAESVARLLLRDFGAVVVFVRSACLPVDIKAGGVDRIRRTGSNGPLYSQAVWKPEIALVHEIC